MQHNKYPKGSEWRKWDFHVHTPASILYNEFGDDWDSFVKILFKKAISNDISAIGITDYFFIDGYKRLKNEYLANERKLAQLFSDEEIERIRDIFIFPNLEFRLEKLVIGKENDFKWDRKLNCHLILSDTIPIYDIEANLLNKLDFEDQGITDSVKQKKSLTKENLEGLGRRLQEEHQEFKEHGSLFVGTLNASISDEQLFSVLLSQDAIFKGKFFFGVPTDEDLSLVSWNSQGHLFRKLLIQKSHFILSANPNTRKFGLGEFHTTKKDFAKEFGGLKPCIWGSDAHKSDKLFNPDLKRNTWIKANPTFEGLKQILYEPEERVKIQENKPESKTPYLVIDKVRFIDQTGKKLFAPTWIEFNQNLNAIIGGKSSGKSLLLYHIASAIDATQVADKTKVVPTNNYDEFKKQNPFDLEVLWLNGDLNKLSQVIEDHINQITYIPQIYINHLAEERGEAHLFELIDSILRQNESFSSFIESQNRKIQATRTIISQTIDSLISLRDGVKKLRTEINEIGTEEKVTKEIERLTGLIEKLRQESGFQSEENLAYDSLVRREKFLDEKKTKYENLQVSVSAFSDFFTKQYNVFENSLKHKLTEYQQGDLDYKVMARIIFEALSSTESVHNDSQTGIMDLSKILSSKIEKISKDLSSVESRLKPFKEKIRNQTLLQEYLKEREKQKDKLILLQRKEKELSGIIAEGKQVNTEVINNYEHLFSLYTEIENQLEQDQYRRIEDLELKCDLRFDIDGFSKFTGLFDGRTRFNSEFYGQFNDHNEFQFDKNRHIADIKFMFDKLRDLNKLQMRTKGGVTLKDVYSALLDDYFKFHYTITHKGDDILKMSPGKRGLVLLELILHISNAMHPILMDQPEDNLDNRTIYEELKKFIRSKKCQRQIIMVTHNANLVVSTDAEAIIVANQSGQHIGKDKKEYIFEYVTGSLENTFVDESESGILYKFGIKEHVCDILEGGKEAFKEREKKYGFAVNS